MAEHNKENVLKIENLKVEFRSMGNTVYAVNGVSLEVAQGEILGLVGESGCGKSATMMSMLGLLPRESAFVTGGRVELNNQSLLEMKEREISNIRGNKVGIIFQDPIVSFNPAFTIGEQLMEPLRRHKNMKKKEASEYVCNMLRLVGISNPRERMKAYPHQFSGGMRQRAMIAMALLCRPDLLIADEPTTALDVTVEAQIVELIKELQKEMHMAIIWITHDLGLIAGLADRIAVMYGGFVVEIAEVERLYENPLHPYTRGLLNSLPRIDGKESVRLEPIEGSPIVQRTPPAKCPFLDRCRYAKEKCAKEIPSLMEWESGHKAACFYCGKGR